MREDQVERIRKLIDRMNEQLDSNEATGEETEDAEIVEWVRELEDIVDG